MKKMNLKLLSIAIFSHLVLYSCDQDVDTLYINNTSIDVNDTSSNFFHDSIKARLQRSDTTLTPTEIQGIIILLPWLTMNVLPWLTKNLPLTVLLQRSTLSQVDKNNAKCSRAHSTRTGMSCAPAGFNQSVESRTTTRNSNQFPHFS